MAKEIIEIDIIPAVNGDSVKDLRQQFNEVEDALFEMAGAGKQNTQEFRNLQKEAAKIKERVDDLNESIDLLKPEAKLQAVANIGAGIASGFAAAQGAASLFGSESEDLQKTLLKVQSAMAIAEGVNGLAGLSDGFKVLGNIIKTNPLMLITTIVLGIGTALFALKDKIAVVGKAFDFFGGVINNVIESVKSFTDWIGISSFKADEANEKLIANAEKAKAAITERYDAEIRAAKRAGKETEEIEESKIRNLYLQNNKQIVALRDLGNKRTDEQNKQFIELVNQNKEYYQDLLDLEDAQNDKIAEKQKQANEKAKERAKKKQEEDSQKRLEENLRLINEWEESQRISDELSEEARKKENERQRLIQEEYETNAKQNEEFEYKLYLEKKKRRELEELGHKQLELQKVEWAKQGLTLISDLNELFAGKSEAAQRKAFEIDKATKLASATISGIEGTINAYKTAQASPITAVFPAYPAIQAGLAAAFAAVNVAKIAKTKFGGTEKAEAPQGGASLGTFTQGSTGQPPQGLTTQNNVTQLNPDGTVAGSQTQSQTVKAYVVESESRAVTERVNKLSNQSKIG